MQQPLQGASSELNRSISPQYTPDLTFPNINLSIPPQTPTPSSATDRGAPISAAEITARQASDKESPPRGSEHVIHAAMGRRGGGFGKRFTALCISTKLPGRGNNRLSLVTTRGSCIRSETHHCSAKNWPKTDNRSRQEKKKEKENRTDKKRRT